MQNYDQYYAKLTANLKDNPKKIYWLNLINTLITRVIYVLYPLLLVILVFKQQEVLSLVLVPGIGFVLLSVLRKILNYPRPYQEWSIEPLINRSEKKGESFPSRHVFSATVISMCFLRINIWMGLVLMIASIILAFCRVLGGVHYPKDVLVGWVMGIIAGSVLFMF